MGWSQLENTELWDVAKEAHASPAGRRFHVFDHPLRLYTIAGLLNVPYSKTLDKAILFHDAIYTGRADDVQKSAALLLDVDPGATEPADLIMTTETHTPGRDNRLILLDLHDLGDPELARSNRLLLAEEYAHLKGLSADEFFAGNTAFMLNLKHRIIDAVKSSQVHRNDLDAFGRIIAGINQVFVPDAPSPSM